MKLDPERLKGPRGITVIENAFKDFKFHGKGHERLDLNRVMKRLEHWAHRLYPRFQFDDCLDKIEKLGQKKPVQVNVLLVVGFTHCRQGIFKPFKK
jgi:TIMELESS-interacting protein